MAYVNRLFSSFKHCICWNWHSVLCKKHKTRCRGFKGPVPPPLWIRRILLLFSYLLKTIIIHKGSQCQTIL